MGIRSPAFFPEFPNLANIPSTPNPPNRQYELVTCMTPDRVKLHGMFQAPSVAPQLTVDAAIVLHGLGSNFYSSTLNLRLADALSVLGMATVLANTRGHDGISMSPVDGRARTIGAAHEIVDDCRHDVAGWVKWLVDRKGFSRIVLVGHSLGAIKSLYTLAHGPCREVQAVIGLSATRLCHGNFLQSQRAADFQKWFDLARQLVRDERADELIRVDFPFPTWMCAGAYVDKYGPEDRYDWLRFIDEIRVPALLLFGERELTDNAAFHGLWQQASEAVATRPHFQLQTVASANHFYAGVHHRAAGAAQDWLRDNFGNDRTGDGSVAG